MYKIFNKNNEWESYFIRAMWNKKKGRDDRTKKFIENYKMIFDYFEKNNISYKQVKLFFKKHGGFNKGYKFIKTQMQKKYIKNVTINNTKNEIIANLCEILSLIIYNLSNKLCKNNDNFNNIEKLDKETMYMIFNK